MPRHSKSRRRRRPFHIVNLMRWYFFVFDWLHKLRGDVASHDAEFAVLGIARNGARSDWAKFVHQEVPRRLFDHWRWHGIELFNISVNECVLAEKIHHTRNPA